MLSDEERKIVKEYIENMRRERSGKAVRNSVKEETLKNVLLKNNTMILKELIYLGGGKDCFVELEKYVKAMAIIAFKDAVGQYENEMELRRIEAEKERLRLQEMASGHRLP